MDGFGVDPIPGLEPLVPETVGMDTVRLRVRNGPAAGSEFELCGLRTRLGRNDPPASVVDIDLTSCELGTPPKISRRHAEIQWVDGALSLVDLGSANGTWVDEVRVVPITETGSVPVVLRAGSRLRLANVELEIVLDAR